MRTKVILALAVVLMLIISTAAIGSNMGFKISISLVARTPILISIPFSNSYRDARSLARDIPDCTSVSRLDPLTGHVETYRPHSSRTHNFALLPGEAYFVETRRNSTATIVGAHDPSVSVRFYAGKPGFVSVPYHSTATTAGQLFRAIPGCSQIARFDNRTGSWVTISATSQNDFALVPGEGVCITVDHDCTWSPMTY